MRLAPGSMRLLHTTNYTLHEFNEKDTPPYAILSHRWGLGEVLFRDIENGEATFRLGWAKIAAFCKQAHDDGFRYGVCVWLVSLGAPSVTDPSRFL